MTLSIVAVGWDGTSTLSFTQGYRLIGMDWDPFDLVGTIYYENDDSVTLDDTVSLSVQTYGDTIADGFVYSMRLAIVGLFLYVNVVHN